ncbi:ectoine/hydroxyectoine ABC transporter permease subunit EhuC [Leucobacter aridicollis]|nr:ectoine/hydroxyectoine ABC transporter permease subunit EhuC [Leucobacter aridicollis]
MEGLGITVTLTIGGALLAFAVAGTLGLMARSERRTVRGVSRVIVEFFRGTSLVVQLFFLFFVLPLFGIELSPILVGVLGLGLNYGAYGAEVVRGSINAVPAGQWEASVALSMSRVGRMRRVILPQAWAIMLPSLANLLVLLLKGTAIVSFITMFDLTASINKLRIDTNVFFAYSVGLLMYFALAWALSFVMLWLEARAKRRLGRGTPFTDLMRNSTSQAPGSDVAKAVTVAGTR